MATEHDGSVKIDTTLDTSGFKRGAQDLQRATTNLAKSIENAGEKAGEAFNQTFQNVDTDGMQAATERISGIDEALEEARQKAEEARQALESYSAERVPTDQYQDLLQEIEDVEAEVDGLKRKIVEMSEAKADLSSLQDIKMQLAEAERALGALWDRADTMASSGKAFVSPEQTADFKSLQQAAQEAQEALNALEAQKAEEQMSALSAAESVAAENMQSFCQLLETQFDEAINHIAAAASRLPEALSNPVQTAQAVMTRLNAVMADPIRAFDSAVDSIRPHFEAVTEAAATSLSTNMDNASTRVKQIVGSIPASVDGAMEQVGNAIARNVEGKFQNFTNLKANIDAIKSMGAAAASAAGRVSTLAQNLAKTAVSKVASGIRNIVNGIKNIGKHSSKSILSANALTKSIFKLKNMLLSRIKQTFITYLFNEFKKGVQELAKVDAEFDESVSNLRNRTTELAANMVSAFGSILKTFEPYITAIIDAAANAMAKVSALLAKLRGESTVAIAKKQTASYAQSLNDSAKAANKSATAQKKLNAALSSYDQLHKLDGKDDSDASRDEENETGASGLFDVVPVDEVLADASGFGRSIINSILRSIATGDWYGVGQALAGGINRLNDTIQLKINEIKPKAAAFAAGLAEALNGLTQNINGNALGRTFADALNTVFNTIYIFVTTYDWAALGTLIGSYFNGIFMNIDWPLIGATLAASFNGVIDVIYGIINNIDWVGSAQNFAAGFNTMCADIDWAKLGQTISDLFKGVLDWLITAVEGIDWFALGEDVLDMLANIDWDGICDRVFEVIGAAFGGIFAFFSGLFADALEKLSDWWNNTAFDECGDFTLEGLFNGLLEAAKNIGEWVKEHIGKPFIDGFKKALGIASPSKVMAEQGGYLIEGLKNGIQGDWSSLSSMVANNAENLTQMFDKKWKDMKETTEKRFDAVGKAMRERMEQAADDVSGCIQNVQKYAADGFDQLTNDVGQRWENVKNTISQKADAIKGLLPQKWQQIISNAAQSFTNLSSTISGLMSGLWNTLTRFDFSYIGTCIIAGIQTGLIKAWSGFWNFTTGLFGGLIAHVKSLFGIASPSKVFAEIGGYLVAGLDEGIAAEEPAVLRSVADMAQSITDSMEIKAPGIETAEIGETENNMLAHLSAVADRLSGIARTFAAIDKALVSMGGVQIPAMATGTIIPPSTRIAADRDSMPETDPELLQLLRKLLDAVTTRDPQGGGTRVPIEIVSKIDKREIARTITEIEIQNGRLTNGRSRV